MPPAGAGARTNPASQKSATISLMINPNELNPVLRSGHVTDFDPASHTARVFFPETGITSDWLPVLVPSSLRTTFELPLSQGEHVACLMFGNGSESGFILGAFYDRKNPPPIAQDYINIAVFPDESFIANDSEQNIMHLHGTGEIIIDAAKSVSFSGGGGHSMNLKAKSITLDAESITLNANSIHTTTDIHKN